MRFFNKSRFKIIKIKGLQKYLVYAIGEIILVVVGILIALTINNWNQDKVDEQELNRIIATVESDLKSDLIESKAMIDYIKPTQKLIAKILYDPKFKDSLRNCDECKYLLTGTYVTNFKSKGYDLLNDFNNEMKTKNVYADSTLSFYELYSRESFQIKNQIVLDDVIENLKYLRDNHEWFTEYFGNGTCESESCLDYFESAHYMNRLTYNEAMLYDDLLYQVEQYHQSLIEFLKFLKTREQ